MELSLFPLLFALFSFSGCASIPGAPGYVAPSPSPSARVSAIPAPLAAPSPAPSPVPAPSPSPSFSLGQLDAQISTIVAGATGCSRFDWPSDRGVMTLGYTKGVALTFAKSVCDFQRGDAGAKLIAKPLDADVQESTRDVYDALSWYASNFRALGMANAGNDLATLRHVYTLLLGLGVMESSGTYCEGRDTSAGFTSSSAAEAGAWQTSYGTMTNKRGSAQLEALYALYQSPAAPSCRLDIFSTGVSCDADNWKYWGTGSAGLAFQKMEKTCPAFAGEYAAMVMRISGGTVGEYGPLRKKAAQINPACDVMLNRVQDLVVASGCGK